MTKQELWSDYINWLEMNGKATTGMNDVYMNNNGKIKVEKKMTTRIETSADDWFNFCKEKGYNDGAHKLIAITE